MWTSPTNNCSDEAECVVCGLPYGRHFINECPHERKDGNMFVVKDSGERKEFASGMVRDTSSGKTEWHRITEGPMMARWAEHLTKGAAKYPDVEPGKANWTLAEGSEELARFKASAFRHFMQWYRGDRDEDHAAAVFFNINGAEYVQDRMSDTK